MLQHTEPACFLTVSKHKQAVLVAGLQYYIGQASCSYEPPLPLHASSPSGHPQPCLASLPDPPEPIQRPSPCRTSCQACRGEIVKPVGCTSRACMAAPTPACPSLLASLKLPLKPLSPSFLIWPLISLCGIPVWPPLATPNSLAGKPCLQS